MKKQNISKTKDNSLPIGSSLLEDPFFKNNLDIVISDGPDTSKPTYIYSNRLKKLKAKSNNNKKISLEVSFSSTKTDDEKALYLLYSANQ